jgi:NCS2 family nucleobase:cation symporter-2
LTAAVALIFGIADFTITIGELSFTGIATGSFGAIIIYHVLRSIQRVTGAGVLAPATEPEGPTR